MTPRQSDTVSRRREPKVLASVVERPTREPVHTAIEPDQFAVLLQLIDAAEDISITIDNGCMHNAIEVGRGFLQEMMNAALNLNLGFEVAGRLLGVRLLDHSGTIMLDSGLNRGVVLLAEETAAVRSLMILSGALRRIPTTETALAASEPVSRSEQRKRRTSTAPATEAATRSTVSTGGRTIASAATGAEANSTFMCRLFLSGKERFTSGT